MQLCSLFYSIARNRFIPTYIGDIVEWWVHDYNDVNGAELACNGITIKILVGDFLEGGEKTLWTSTITVSGTRQYACHWKENINFFKTV